MSAIGTSTSASLAQTASASAAVSQEFGGLLMLSMTAAPDEQSRPAGCLEHKANATLFLDALTPYDHSHLLHSEEHGIQKGGLLHQILEKDRELFPYATKAQTRSSTDCESLSSYSSLSTVAASSSFASAASACLASDQDCDGRDCSSGAARSLEHRSRASQKATIHGRDGVIYPRRKSGEESRKASQVVVSPEILKEHFDMPLQDAATKLGVCTSAIKKACRRFGIPKWPFRRARGAAKAAVKGQHAACPSGRREGSADG